MKMANIEKVMTKANIAKIVKDENISKSEKIRNLFDGGVEVKEISNVLNIRYNFVYNVVSNYIIQNDLTVEKSTKVTKKSQILDLYKEGKSLKEISIEMKTNYNYVHSIVKEYKLSLEQAE